MHFTQAFLAAATVALASANAIYYVNQDATKRTIKFKPHAGMAWIPDTVVPGRQTVKVEVPEAWGGMSYSVSEGVADKGFGMLAEFQFQAYGGMTFFDVSAIDDPNDHDGVKLMFPSNGKAPFSGCESQQFPCDNVYNAPNDVQTKATAETEIVVLIGNLGASKRSGRIVIARDPGQAFPREFLAPVTKVNQEA